MQKKKTAETQVQQELSSDPCFDEDEIRTRGFRHGSR